MKEKKKIKMILFVVLLILLVLLPRLTRSVRAYTPPENRVVDSSGISVSTAMALQDSLDEQVNLLHVPGLQAAIRTAEGESWSGASGTADLAREVPLTTDSVLRIGSVTKTFTAVIVLQMVEEGLLSLEDPLANWFPEVPQADQITVRQLLNHTSGVPEIIPKIMMKSIIPSTWWEKRELVEIIAGEELIFSPGTEFSYSNSNYILLGLIAEEVSGQGSQQLLHDRILDPLGMKDTYFLPYDTAPVTLVPGFDRDLSHFPGMLDIQPENVSWATGAYTSGAMASTADDLLVFTRSLFSGELLSPIMMEEMQAAIPAPNPGFKEQIGYGLGLMQLDVEGVELVGHLGQFMGSSAILLYEPGGGNVFAVISNLSNPDLIQVVQALKEVIQN